MSRDYGAFSVVWGWEEPEPRLYVCDACKAGDHDACAGDECWWRCLCGENGHADDPIEDEEAA